MTPGPQELIIILVIILLLFGASRIPALARSLGSGVREFKRGTAGEFDEAEENDKEEELTRGAGAGAAGADTHTARMREETEQATGQTTDHAEQRQGSGEPR